jgi:hypothetical protein
MVDSNPDSTLASYLTPTSDIVILTDASRSAGVFSSPMTQIGVMLSRGAVSLLESLWFSHETMAIGAAVSSFAPSAHVAHFTSQVPAWVERHPGLAVSPQPPRLGPIQSSGVTAPHAVQRKGMRSIPAGSGTLLSREVATYTVQYHKASEALAQGTVPIIETPMSLVLDQGMPQFLPRPVSGAVPATVCATCSICSSCAACALCGEVNDAVGAIGLGGIAGSVGLASIAAPPRR